MPNAEDYAIVVGITDYASFQELLAAEGDATAFADWLRSPDGGDIPRDQVKVIVSSDIKSPTGTKGVYPWKDNVDDELAKIINKRTGRIGRRFYFYFSGHGCVPSADQILLLLANTSNDTMRRNIGADPYQKWLANAALFDELVFILDCCRGSESPTAPPEPPYLTPIAQSPNFIKVKAFVALGTGYGQYSFAPDLAGERSFFTKHLLDGLKGKAVAADGSITAAALSEYVTSRVRIDALRFGREQIPEIPVKPNIIFKPGKPGQQGQQGQRSLTFTVPAEWTRPLELLDGLSNVIRRTDGTARQFKAIVVPGLYQIRYPADAPPGGASPLNQLLRVAPGGGSVTVALDPQMDASKAQYNV